MEKEIFEWLQKTSRKGETWKVLKDENFDTYQDKHGNNIEIKSLTEDASKADSIEVYIIKYITIAIKNPDMNQVEFSRDYKLIRIT